MYIVFVNKDKALKKYSRLLAAQELAESKISKVRFSDVVKNAEAEAIKRKIEVMKGDLGFSTLPVETDPADEEEEDEEGEENEEDE